MFYSSWFSSQGVKSAWLIMRKVSFSCLSWLTELCYWWGNPLTIPTLLFFQWVGLLLWKDFFYFIFLHHNHFQERVKMQWTNTKQHIVCSQTHLLAIRNKDIVMHFCIYLHLLLFSNSKAMSIFYIQSTYRASLLWPFQELMFFAFLHIIVLFQCLFSLFLFFSLLLFYLGKKRSCPSRYIHYMPCWFSQATMQNYAPY